MTEITALSTKGQLVLPKSIRIEMNLSAGSKFLIYCDGENILLKPIKEPSAAEFQVLLKKTQAWALKVGMKQEDIDEAITDVRKTGHNANSN